MRLEDEEVYPPSYTCEGEAIQENSSGRNMTRLGDSFLRSFGAERLPQQTKTPLKECLAQQKRTSAAKAALHRRAFGTAEAVPLSKTDFFHFQH
jgi:hypothetical protein